MKIIYTIILVILFLFVVAPASFAQIANAGFEAGRMDRLTDGTRQLIFLVLQQI